MAKKKTASKKAPKSLRQAIMQFKTAIINFSRDHQLFIAYDPDSRETYIADTPAEIYSQFILGEESGDSAPTPVITYKLIIKDTCTDTFTSVGSTTLRLIVNGVYKETHIEDIGITAGNEYEWLMPVFEDSYDSGKWYFTCPVYNDNDYTYGTPSDIVNLTPAVPDDHPYYSVTDPTQNGSITVTFE